MSAPPGTAPPPAYGPTAMPPMGPPMGPPMKPKTMKPTIAGIFMIIAGIEGMVLWGLVAAAGGELAGLVAGI
ncbi:MAG: hypothetical protein AABX36_01165, partial [Candidatus Thermoplasmatota archaeon]